MRLELAHAAGVPGARMIHPEQMQHAVDEEHAQLLVQRYTTRRRLTRCGVERDDDVPEQAARVLCARPLALRKREHVGGVSAEPEACREVRDAGVVGERHRQIGVKAAQGA